MEKKEESNLYDPIINAQLVAKFKGYRWNVIPNCRRIKRKNKR